MDMELQPIKNAMANQLKNCYVLLKRILIKDVEYHGSSKQPKNSESKRKYPKLSNKQPLEVDDTEVGPSQVKTCKMKKCETITSKKITSSVDSKKAGSSYSKRKYLKLSKKQPLEVDDTEVGPSQVKTCKMKECETIRPTYKKITSSVDESNKPRNLYAKREYPKLSKKQPLEVDDTEVGPSQVKTYKMKECETWPSSKKITSFVDESKKPRNLYAKREYPKLSKKQPFEVDDTKVESSRVITCKIKECETITSKEITSSVDSKKAGSSYSKRKYLKLSKKQPLEVDVTEVGPSQVKTCKMKECETWPSSKKITSSVNDSKKPRNLYAKRKYPKLLKKQPLEVDGMKVESCQIITCKEKKCETITSKKITSSVDSKKAGNSYATRKYLKLSKKQPLEVDVTEVGLSQVKTCEMKECETRPSSKKVTSSVNDSKKPRNLYAKRKYPELSKKQPLEVDGMKVESCQIITCKEKKCETSTSKKITSSLDSKKAGNSYAKRKYLKLSKKQPLEVDDAEVRPSQVKTCKMKKCETIKPNYKKTTSSVDSREPRNPYAKIKYTKLSKKQPLEVDDMEDGPSQVKKFKIKECETITSNKITSNMNRSMSLTHSPEEIKSLINAHKLVTIDLLTNLTLQNLQNNNIRTLSEPKELNEFEKQVCAVEQNIDNNTEITKETSETDIGNFEQTNKQIDSTKSVSVTDRMEVKENNQNNSNICKGDKNLNEDQNLQKNQQEECLTNGSDKPEATVKENNTSDSFLINIEEQNTDESFEQGKPKELTNTNYFEQPMQRKENNKSNYTIVKQVINETEVDNLSTTKQEMLTTNEYVKQGIDIIEKKYDKCSFKLEKGKKIEVKVTKQEESNLMERGLEVKDNIKNETKSMQRQKSKSLNRILKILSSVQKINIDKDYLSLHFYHTSSKHCNTLSHSNILNEIRSIYMFYFNEAIEPMLDILSSALPSRYAQVVCWLNKERQKSSQEVDFHWKDYGELFVQIFKGIQGQFFEVHRSLMITVLYLQLLIKAAKQALIKPRLMKTVVARLFKIENYRNSYDNISNSSHKNAKTTLNFVKKWLGKTVVEPNLKSEKGNFRDFFPNSNDKIDKTVVFEDNNQELISATQNNQIVDLHLSLVEVQNDFLDFKVNKEIEMILDFHHSQQTEERHEEKSFHINTLEGITGEDCSNIESCSKKKVVPCLFCYELVCCEDFCEVQDDQLVCLASDKYDFITCITCTHHKSFSWNEELFKDWIEAKDHPMLYDPICWNVTCDKRATVVCLCKAKGYCSLDCQVEDWENGHYDNCTQKPHQDLLWNPSENDSLLSGWKFDPSVSVYQ